MFNLGDTIRAQLNDIVKYTSDDLSANEREETNSPFLAISSICKLLMYVALHLRGKL